MARQAIHETSWAVDEKVALAMALVPIVVLQGGALGLIFRDGWPSISHGLIGYVLIAVLLPAVSLWFLTWRICRNARWWHWPIAAGLVVYWLGFFFQWSFIMPYAMLNRLAMWEMLVKGIQR